MTTIAEKTENGAKAEHTPQRCETCGGSGGVEVSASDDTPVLDACPDCDGSGFVSAPSAKKCSCGGDAQHIENSCRLHWIQCTLCGMRGPRRETAGEALNAWAFIVSTPKLADFKAYVHHRLDAAGVPVDPESPHKAEGCRIGGRLDIVLKHYATAQQSLAAMKQGRSALAVLAQSDPTYEPAWRGLTDAIKLAEGPMRPAPEETCEQPSEEEQVEFDRLNVPERHEGD